MPKKLLTSGQRIFALILVSLYLAVGCAGIFAPLNASAQAPAPATPASTPANSGSGTSTGNTVKQPAIIPQEAITSQGKVYIPYNASGESTRGYLENRLLPGIAATIIGLTGGLALLFTVISGIMLLVSYGNPDMAGKARKTLVYSLIGVIGAGLSYAIVAIIASINP